MELSIYFDDLLGRSSNGKFSPTELKTFLREMRRTPSGPLIISKLLANKIQSKTESVALQAFDFLEATLETEVEGSIEFRTEVGRYRFLNEIIRILSPKYLGCSTPDKIKQRAIRFLKAAAGIKRKKWFPSEFSKIETVYKSLVDGGVIIVQKEDDDANDPDAEFRKNIFERGENAILLKKLLQSKDPADLQAANRLIKNLVDEEAKRNERRSELHSLIDRIETSTSLLGEMLSQSCIVDYEIIDELVETCNNLRNRLGNLRTETNEETTSLVQASENIESVLQLYEEKKKNPNSSNADAMNALGEEDIHTKSKAPGIETKIEAMSSLSLVDELLMGIDSNLVVVQESSQAKKKLGKFDDDNLLNLDIEIGEPASLCGESGESSKNNSNEDVGSKQPYFDELDKMSRQLMDQSLLGTKSYVTSSITTKPELKKTDKTSLSQLQLLQSNSSSSNMKTQQNQGINNSGGTFTSISNSAYMDLDFLEKSDMTRINNNSSKSNNKSGSEQIEIPSVNNGRIRIRSTEDDNLLGLDLDEAASTSAAIQTPNVTSYSNNVTLPISTPPAPTPTSTTTITPKSGSKTATSASSSSSLSSTPLNHTFQLNSIKDIQLDIDDIELIDHLSPIHVDFEDHINLTFTFGQFPKTLPTNVKAAVITITNKNTTEALFNYVFQLLPPKGVQVKLLPPSCMELGQWKKTFLPPPVLTQLALFVVPPPKSISSQPSNFGDPGINLKYILSYCLGEETVVHNETILLPHY